MPTPQHQAKRPVTVLAGGYGHPVHPLFVTVPIGAWTASLAFDIASRFVTGPGFLARGSLWLIAAGVIGALVAACTGLLDLLAIPAGTGAHRTALTHMCLNAVVTAAYAVGFAWRYPGYHHPGPVPAAQIALSAASLAALAVAGYLGGTLVYRYGVRVADERTQAEGYAGPFAAPSAQAKRTLPAAAFAGGCVLTR